MVIKCMFSIPTVKNSPSDNKDDEDTDGGKMQCDDEDEEEEEEEETEETHTTFTTESGHEVVLSVIIPRSLAGSNTTDTVSRMSSDNKPLQITSTPPNTEIIWLPAANHPPPPPLYSIKQQLNYSQVGSYCM